MEKGERRMGRLLPLPFQGKLSLRYLSKLERDPSQETSSVIPFCRDWGKVSISSCFRSLSRWLSFNALENYQLSPAIAKADEDFTSHKSSGGREGEGGGTVGQGKAKAKDEVFSVKKGEGGGIVEAGEGRGGDM